MSNWDGFRGPEQEGRMNKNEKIWNFDKSAKNGFMSKNKEASSDFEM